MDSEKIDLFATASGKFSLTDFLLTRFAPGDLASKIQIDPAATVTEHLAPIKPKVAIAPMPAMFPTPEAVAQAAAVSNPAPAVAENPNPLCAKDFVEQFQEAADQYTKKHGAEGGPTS